MRHFSQGSDRLARKSEKPRKRKVQALVEKRRVRILISLFLFRNREFERDLCGVVESVWETAIKIFPSAKTEKN